MGMFFVAGIGVALLIEFLLISKKNKSGSDRILTLWMFLILVHLFLFYTHFTEDIYRFPFLLGIEIPLPLLHGVFLYLYVSSVTNQLPRYRKLLLLHFLPVTALYLYLTSFFLLPAVQKMEVYRNHGAGHETFYIIKTIAIAVSGIVYVVWSLLLLRAHRRNIREQFSDLGPVNLQWLRLLTLGMGGVWCLVIFFGNDILVYSGVVVFVFLIGFFGVRQSDIFHHGGAAEENVVEREKYSKSGLTEEASSTIHQSLIRLMTVDALYRETELSIGDLASRLNVHPNYLSQAINEREGKNFYDFVNTYRIEEFKRLIAIPKNQQLTLLSLAFDCGFNSKTSFNRYFKKATGQTPSEYFSSITSTQHTSA